MRSNVALFKQAQRRLVGGVNSPVRAFGAVGGVPRFIDSGAGAIIHDCEGGQYIDYVGAWGPCILGHAHPRVLEALQQQLVAGISFGAPHELETTLANILCDALPSVEQIRFTNSGTEAVMSAIRLARGYSKRDGVIKFIGGYHGHSDSMLTKDASDALGAGKPGSGGVPESAVAHTFCAEYNNIESVERIFEAHRKDIACVIVEPIAGNMGCVLPEDTFLPGLRDLCERFGALLIFDEVMTGFRVAYGGAQNRFNISPDLTVLGKIIGGGLPIGAVGGRQEIMSKLAPLGSVYQAGTLSGSPLAMCAGIATMKELQHRDFYTQLEARTRELATGLQKRAHEAGVLLAVSWSGGMFGMFFGAQSPATNNKQARACKSDAFVQFFWRMLDEGVYLAPSPYEAGFVSGAHDASIIESTLDAATRAFEPQT